MLTRRRCCCGSNPDCLYTCEDCPIPLAGMPVTWSGTGTFPGGSATINLTGVGTWSTGLIPYDHGAVYFTGEEAEAIKFLGIDMGCDGDTNTTRLSVTFFNGAGVGLITCTTDGFSGTREEYTCDPFLITGNFCGVIGCVGSCAAVNHFETATVDGSGLTGGCCQTFNVVGCNGLPVRDATVNVRSSSGGTILATGTTDFNGNCSLIWIGGCSVYAEVEYSPEFDTFGDDYSLTGGGGVEVTPSVASGYHCLPTCAVPLPDTLHSTHPVFGALTYTYSAGSWVSTTVYSFPGWPDTGAPASTVTITSKLNGSTRQYTESWKTDDDGYPTNSGGNTYTVTWDTGAKACPPGLSLTYGRFADGVEEQSLYESDGSIALSLSLSP